MSEPSVVSNASAGGYKEWAKTFAHRALDPVVRALIRMGVRPDHLTALGFGLSLAAALAFALGRFRVAATITVFAGICDILDGQIARQMNASTKFGAFFDSTLDRVAEAALLVGIAWFYMSNLVDMAMNPERVLSNLQNGLEPVTWAIIALLSVLAIVGSFMVSYTRARAEGLGLSCKVGWFERPERMVLLIVAGFAGLGPIIPGALLVLVTLSFATAIQRMVHVYRLTRGAGSDTSEG